MKLLAINKKDGSAYFLYLEKISKVSFPYTADFVRSADDNELEYAISFYGYIPADESFSTFNELIEYVKRLTISEIKSQHYYGQIENIDVDEILQDFSAESLKSILLKIELLLLNPDSINRAPVALEKIRRNASKVELSKVRDKMNELDQAVTEFKWHGVEILLAVNSKEDFLNAFDSSQFRPDNKGYYLFIEAHPDYFNSLNLIDFDSF